MPEVENIISEVINPRAISKKVDPEGRSQTALSILEARSQAREVKNEISIRDEQAQSLSIKKEGLIQNQELHRRELLTRQSRLLVKLKRLIHIGDKTSDQLQAELESIKEKIQANDSQNEFVSEELEALHNKQGEVPDPHDLLKAYYEKMATTPLTNEEKREVLKPELLATLTTEEYIALWRRLNPHFLAHVTRQGFRDHNAMVYHSAGMNSFQDGFVEMLKDGKMNRPPLFLEGLRSRDYESVKKFLSFVLEAENEDEARVWFNDFLYKTIASAPKYADKTAVHFTAQQVLNDYYGGESRNEVFFVYPSDVVASQYNYSFNGWTKSFASTQGAERMWNDIFVWPQSLDNPGIPMDAGIVFLPKTTQVDPETGSKYASEVKVINGQEQRVMIEDQDLQQAFEQYVQELTDDSHFEKLFKEHNNPNHLDYYRKQMAAECIRVLTADLQSLGFGDEAANDLAYQYYNYKFSAAQSDERLQACIHKSRATFKRPQTVVTAEAYWTKYFQDHPELKPQHVTFYEGDPTTAVYKFLQENNIGKADTSGSEGDLLGFDDHHVLNKKEDPRANRGLQELLEMGIKIIEEHYRQKSQPETTGTSEKTPPTGVLPV